MNKRYNLYVLFAVLLLGLAIVIVVHDTLQAIGNAENGTGAVTNLSTQKTFDSLQRAIDDSNTENGDVLEVDSGSYDSINEPGGHRFGNRTALINVSKSLTIQSTAGAAETVLNARGHSIVVRIAANDVILSGFTITGTTGAEDGYCEAISITDNRAEITISNNILRDNECTGVWAKYAVGFTIRANEIRDHGDAGIHISGGSGNRIVGNTVDNCLLAGIHVEGGNVSEATRHNIVESNTISDTGLHPEWKGGHGIFLWTNRNDTVRHNTVRTSAGAGIYAGECNGCTINENELAENESRGIELKRADRTSVTDNEVFGTYSGKGDSVTGIGILLHGTDYNVPEDFNTRNVISDNHVRGNAFGILVTHASETGISTNTVEGNKSGVFGISSVLTFDDDSWVYLQSKIEAGGGIFVNGRDNTLMGNTITDNGFGIEIQGGQGSFQSVNNVIESNELVGNNSGSVSVELSKWEMVNDSWENTVIIPLEEVAGFGLLALNTSTTEVSANLSQHNGQFGVGLRGFADEDHGWRGASTGASIRNNDVRYQQEGIWLGPTTQDSLVEGNAISDNRVGIKAENARANEVHCNQIVNNHVQGLMNMDTLTLDARNNWWGSVEGPGADDTNGVEGNVIVEPWLTSPGCN